MANQITLQGFRIKNNYEGSSFQRAYERLLLPSATEISEEEKKALLRWAVFFFNRGDDGVRRLGYRIIARYSILFGDYIPLYDIALNAGFIPVSGYIEQHFFQEEGRGSDFLRSFMSAYKGIYRDGDRYLSEGQMELFEFNKSVSGDALIVAPTSYGKSEMMILKAKESIGKKVCLIAPSKALLSQTKRRLLQNEDIAERVKRVITHPEMFGSMNAGDASFIAVLTQERLFRVIKSDPGFSVDVLLVDEAHNLLSGDGRGALLLQVILILKHRNPGMELRFYTPFVADAKSLESPYSSYSLKSAQSKEFIKIERYFVYDARETRQLSIYDQFMNKHIPVKGLDMDEFAFINSYKAKKNIVYLNKPRDVESAAVRISGMMESIGGELIGDGEFSDAYKAISDFLHPDYKLLACLRKGVVYHHGKMPEIIRLYVEEIFSKNPNFSFVVTTSTLMEGVNIPAQRMFLLSPKRGRRILSRAAFKNLTGRICRFGEMFSDEHGDLSMLEPEIYVVAGDYFGGTSSPFEFLSNQAKLKPADKDQDQVENVLLSEVNDLETRADALEALEYIENIERGAVEVALKERELGAVRYVSSVVASACFKNNIRGFDIHENEKALDVNYEIVAGEGALKDPVQVLDAIYGIFISNISVIESEENREFLRLGNASARKFYAMFLDWRINGITYSQMIGSYLAYWKKLEDDASPEDELKIYVGNAWGEVKWSEDEFIPRYVDLRKKDARQRVNLAIVKIKEEQDFVEFSLMKYIDVLNDLGLIEKHLYDRIKYGSSDERAICLMKGGVSLELANCLLRGEYLQYVEFDFENDEARISRSAIDAMNRNGENRVLIFELQFHAV